MVRLDVILREPAFPDFEDKEIIHLGGGAKPIRIAGLTEGMTSGETAIGIAFELPDGRVVLAETSLKLFLIAADILKAAYGDPRE